MKLNDLLTKSLETCISECDVVKLVPVSNDNGDIVKIIIEYIPNNNQKQ